MVLFDEGARGRTRSDRRAFVHPGNRLLFDSERSPSRYFDLTNRLSQNDFCNHRRRLRGLWMAPAQAGYLQKCLAGA